MPTPTPPVPRPGRRPGPRAFVAVLCALLLAGCAGLTELVKLGGRLEQAGLAQVSTQHSSDNGLVRLRVQAQLKDPRADAEAAGQSAAKVVWDTYPRRVDELEIALNGRLVLRASHAELTDRLGERNPQLEETTGDGDLGFWLPVVLILLAVLLAGGLTGLLLWLRHRRQRRAAVAAQRPPPCPSAVAWPPYQGPPPPSGRGRTH
ncbi:hypothetical protein M8C13_42170 [Crossiella sp. SN42]|uniref:hypothetical protein n=1 Tax=Crossiella sp. SN42 TaxID=2944808 RepID=UPI00207D0F27|nr:hypothetical protein [Crossiella sp. SN42]MCO1582376.1 hypothetical protein [Crossiella sp. SN42]